MSCSGFEEEEQQLLCRLELHDQTQQARAAGLPWAWCSPGPASLLTPSPGGALVGNLGTADLDSAVSLWVAGLPPIPLFSSSSSSFSSFSSFFYPLLMWSLLHITFISFSSLLLRKVFHSTHNLLLFLYPPPSLNLPAPQALVSDSIILLGTALQSCLGSDKSAGAKEGHGW